MVMRAALSAWPVGRSTIAPRSEINRCPSQCSCSSALGRMAPEAGLHGAAKCARYSGMVVIWSQKVSDITVTDGGPIDLANPWDRVRLAILTVPASR